MRWGTRNCVMTALDHGNGSTVKSASFPPCHDPSTTEMGNIPADVQMSSLMAVMAYMPAMMVFGASCEYWGVATAKYAENHGMNTGTIFCILEITGCTLRLVFTTNFVCAVLAHSQRPDHH